MKLKSKIIVGPEIENNKNIVMNGIFKLMALINQRYLKFSLCLLLTFHLTALMSDELANPRVTPTVKAVYKVIPAVVNLSTETIVGEADSPWRRRGPFDDAIKEFFSKQDKRKNRSLGSGCVIDPAGLVLTVSHVVNRATRINVTLADGSKFLAREIANAELNDIALLQISDFPNDKELGYVHFAKVGDLFLGETVIAVGNPYGLGNSISKGVISAVNRNFVYRGQVVLNDIIQTDVAINPGNSGGPLVNINGNMIGINYATHKDAQGIGFAISLLRVENLLGQWLIPERFGNFSLGIVPQLRHKGEDSYEIYISQVLKDSPAFAAGVVKNMVLTSFNGKPIDTLIDLGRSLWKKRDGDVVKFTIEGGRKFALTVRKLHLSDGRALARIRLGLGLQELSKPLAESLGYPLSKGVIISENLTGNPDIRKSDLLVSLGNTPIYNFTDVARVLRDKRYGAKLSAAVISIYPDTKRLSKKLVNLEVK